MFKKQNLETFSSNHNVESNYIKKEDLDKFKVEIQNLFSNLFITDINTVSNRFEKSSFLKLINKGFSKNL